MIKKVFSKKIPNKLLHVINFFDNNIIDRQDLSDPSEFLQIMFLKNNKDKIYKAHKHLKKKGNENVITQESLIVINGKILCTFYDSDGTFIEEQTISSGDCVITFYGGHKYEILEDNTFFYEVKNGPYLGQIKDKKWIVDE